MGELLGMLERVVNFCENRGAEAEVVGLKRREIIAVAERNDIKLCIKQYSTGIGIRTFTGKSMGFSSCNSAEEDILKETAQKAVRMSRKTPLLPFVGPAHPHPLPQVSGLYDRRIETVDEETVLATAQNMLRAAQKDPRISVDSGELQVVQREKAVSTSTGVSASEKKSQFSWFLIGLAREGNEVGSFRYYYGCCTHKKEMYTQETARLLAENALADLHPRKIEPFSGDIILAPEAVSLLVGEPLTFSANANNVYKGQSLLAGKLEEKIASDAVTIRDNCIIQGDFNASSFDREGAPHQNLPIVENGVLKSFLYDTQAANRDSVLSTGNATGTFREIPKIGVTNFMIEKGSQALDTMVEEIEKGLLINRFSGASSQVSGDFSGAVKGAQFIKSGEIQYPVKEATIAGNVFELLHNISDISKETLRYTQTVLPYMKVPEIRITA